MNRFRLLSLVAAFLLAPLHASATGVIDFSSGFEPTTGDFPVSNFALVDVDRDGTLDLLTTNGTDTSSPHTFSVRRGLGAGSWAAPVQYATGLFPIGIAAGDLNGDHWPDVVVTSRGSSSVSVLLNRGDGTYFPRTNFATGSGPRAVALGDLDGDAALDIVTANSNGGTISILKGDGAGGFAPRVDFTSGADPRALRLIDWNGDGMLDVLAMARGSNAIALHPGNGDATFAPVQLLGLGKTPAAFDARDFDTDGQPDLAVSWTTGTDAALYRRLVGGALGAREDLSLGGTSSVAQIVDVTNDGHADLVFASFGGGETPDFISYFPGLGNGAYQARRDVGTGGDPNLLAVADLDQNGRTDLLVSCAGSMSFAAHLADGTGGFGSKRDLPPHPVVGQVLAADLNHDGKLDLIAPENLALSSWIGHGDGTFEPRSTYAIQKTVDGRLALGDINGDGNLDALTVDGFLNDCVWVHFGDGTGTFSNSMRLSFGGNWPGGALSVATSDIDLDGRLDVIIGSMGSGCGSVHYLRQVAAGQWTEGCSGYWGGTVPNFLEISTGDFTGDGFPDILFAQANHVVLLRSLGGGTFAPATPVVDGVLPRANLAVADYDGDGKLDFAVTENATTVGVWRGDGAGGFTRKFGAQAAGGLSALSVADLDHDGVADLIAGGGSTTPVGPNSVSIFRGLGDGTFAGRVDEGVNFQPRSIAAADFNGDGWADLAAGSTPVALLDNLLAPVVALPSPPVGAQRLALAPPAPNPTRGAIRFAVDVPVAGRLDVRIVDIAGRIVLRESHADLAPGRRTIELAGTANLRAGLYFLRVSQGTATATRRIMVAD